MGDEIRYIILGSRTKFHYKDTNVRAGKHLLNYKQYDCIGLYLDYQTIFKRNVQTCLKELAKEKARKKSMFANFHSPSPLSVSTGKIFVPARLTCAVCVFIVNRRYLDAYYVTFYITTKRRRRLVVCFNNTRSENI